MEKKALFLLLCLFAAFPSTSNCGFEEHAPTSLIQKATNALVALSAGAACGGLLGLIPPAKVVLSVPQLTSISGLNAISWYFIDSGFERNFLTFSQFIKNNSELLKQFPLITVSGIVSYQWVKRRLLNPKLKEACSIQNLKEIKQLLAVGCQVDILQIDGYEKLLFKAIEKKEDQILELFRGKPINWNMTKKVGWESRDSFLHTATQYENEFATNFLLEHKAQVASTTSRNLTPLHFAAQHENVANARALFQHGAPIDAPAESGDTPLFHAIWCEQPGMVEFLLKNNANPNQQTIDGRTPLKEICSALVHASGAHREKLLIILKPLLDHGAIVEHGGPLHLAAKYGSTEIARDHLDAVNVADENNKTPLFYAIKSNAVEVFELLLKHNANLLAKDDEGNTLLHCAVDAGNLKSTNDLIEQYSRNQNLEQMINAPNNSGLTPLRIAFNRWNFTRDDTLDFFFPKYYVDDIYTPVIHLLVENNAEMAHETTPLCEMIKEYGNRSLISKARYSGDLGLIKTVLDKSTLTDCKDKALLAATSVGHLAVIKFLLEQGANINATFDDGMSIVGHALWKRGYDIAQYLLQQGARLDIPFGREYSIYLLHGIVEYSREYDALSRTLGLVFNNVIFAPSKLMNSKENEALTLKDWCYKTLAKNSSKIPQVFTEASEDLKLSLIHFITHHIAVPDQKKILEEMGKNPQENHGYIHQIFDAILKRHLTCLQALLSLQDSNGKTVGEIAKSKYQDSLASCILQLTTAESYEKFNYGLYAKLLGVNVLKTLGTLSISQERPILCAQSVEDLD